MRHYPTIPIQMQIRNNKQQQQTMRRRYKTTSILATALFVSILGSIFQYHAFTRLLLVAKDHHQKQQQSQNTFLHRTLQQQEEIETKQEEEEDDRHHQTTSSSLYQKENSKTTTATSIDINVIDASIIVQLSGEMGNNLNKIAMGRALQLLAKEQYNITTNLILRHQENGHPMKWKLARRDIQKCFPNLRQYNFEAGNNNNIVLAATNNNNNNNNNNYNFDSLQMYQKVQYGHLSNHLSLSPGQSDMESISKAMQTLKSILEKEQQQQQKNQNQSTTKTIITSPIDNGTPMKLLNNNNNNNSNNKWSSSSSSSSSSLVLDQTIHIPFIYADTMVDNYFLDRYREEFQDFFQFDDEACCSLFPDADEYVFHFRNFQTELQSVTASLGFSELSPEKTATELFQHLQPGDKVAITTRFDNAITQQYVHALRTMTTTTKTTTTTTKTTMTTENKGLQVRVVSGQSAVADFCFMKNTKKELVGMARSTFLIWAAYLGQGQVRTYSINTNNNNNNNNNNENIGGEYNWTDPDFDARFQHVTFESP